MRCSWVKKNRSRNIIDWDRTKNDVRSIVSLFGGNLIYTTTSGGRSGLNGEERRGGLDGEGLRGWLAMVVVIASSTWWSVLNLMLVLGTLTGVMASLSRLVADS